MKINITERVNPSAGAQEVVLFASPVGISRGRWMGPEPARLAVYDVELDFPDEVGGFDVLLAGGEGMIEWSVEDESIIAVGIVVTVGEIRSGRRARELPGRTSSPRI